MNKQDSINKFNKMDERTDEIILKQKITNLIYFIDNDLNEIDNKSVTKKKQFGIFIAQKLSNHLNIEIQKVISKRKDLFDKANQQALEQFGNDKHMIDSCTLNLYGMKIFNEFVCLYQKDKSLKNKLLSFL